MLKGRMLRWGILLATIVVVALLAGCGIRETEQLPPLKLGVIPVEDNFPFFVAEQEKMFEKAGLDVELLVFSSAKDRDTALQAGQIDGQVADIVATGLLKKAGTPVKIVLVTMGVTPEEGRFVLLAAPDGSVKVPADLKNIPVAVSQHTIIDYVNYRLLEGAGLNPGEIKTASVPSIPERLQLLLSGSVEAAVLPDPLATLAETKGAKVILDDTKGQENISQGVLLFREDAIRDKSASIEALIKVYGEAAQLVSENPDPYRELFIEKARVPEELKESYLSPKYSSPATPGENEVSAVMDWMLGQNLLEKAYSYDELVTQEFIAGR